MLRRCLDNDSIEKQSKMLDVPLDASGCPLVLYFDKIVLSIEWHEPIFLYHMCSTFTSNLGLKIAGIGQERE